MSQGLIAKKVGMSRLFLESGEAIPVTYLEIKPNVVVRTKTEAKDGYNAVVLGIGAKQWKTRKGNEHTRYELQKEWQVDSLEGLDPGKELTAATIPVESLVTISGTSKGKGFQGVMKRHGFHGGPKTHGSHSHRRPGSVGMCAFPGRVMKGKKLPGQMGNQTITLKRRPVVFCDPEKGILCIKGPVPGPNGANLFVTVDSSPKES
ncbi:MAG: 50S ribosomal protein L3 [Kiritimatiellales bacterium]|nr:50S ribosomal protein L3 [Kiritimatiellales bacterium]